MIHYIHYSWLYKGEIFQHAYFVPIVDKVEIWIATICNTQLSFKNAGNIYGFEVLYACSEQGVKCVLVSYKSQHITIFDIFNI